MKKILLAFILLICHVSASLAVNHDPVKILSANSGILYLKFSKSIQGGTIQIKDENAKVVFSKSIDERRLIIDFYLYKPGKYTVTIMKDEFMETFGYTSAEFGDSEIPVAFLAVQP